MPHIKYGRRFLVEPVQPLFIGFEETKSASSILILIVFFDRNEIFQCDLNLRIRGILRL